MNHELYSCSCGAGFKDLEPFFKHAYTHLPKNHDKSQRLIAFMNHGQLIIVPACECKICRPTN